MQLHRSRRSNWLRRQPVVFLMVGAYNTAFGLAVFALLYLLLPMLHYLGVLILSAVLSTANAFVAYRVMVFKVRGRVALDLARFLVVYAVSLAMNFLALPMLVELAGIAVLPGQALAFLLAAATSYLAHKHFSFRRRPEPGEAPIHAPATVSEDVNVLY